MCQPSVAAALTVGIVVSSQSSAHARDVTSFQQLVAESPNGLSVEEEGSVGVGLLLGGTAIVVAGGAGISAVAVRRRKLTAKRSEVAARVKGPQTRAKTAERRYAQLLNRVDAWKCLSQGTTLREVELQHQKADKTHQQVHQNLISLTKAAPNGVDRASMDELERVEGYLTGLLESLGAHNTALDGLLSVGAKIDHLRVAIPAKQNLLLEEVEAAIALSDELTSRDWDVAEEKTELSNLLAALQNLPISDERSDLFDAYGEQEKLEASLFSTAHRLQRLTSQEDSLRTWQDQLEASYDVELLRIDSSQQRLEELADVHCEESWKWALGHPDAALGQLDSAMTLLRVVDLENLTVGEFDEVGRTLEAAGRQLLVADDLLDQIDDLLVDLDRARIESPGILEQSKNVLESFAAFVAEHADDLPAELAQSPTQLGSAIAELEHELGLARPNYLRVAQTGDRLNREIDDLIIEAQDVQHQAEAIRRAMNREVARAQRSLQRARASMGWQLFDSPDSQALDQLARRLPNIPSDPAAGLAAASRIADASIAIRERIIARRRRNVDWVLVGTGPSWAGGVAGNASATTSTAGGSFGGGRSRQSW